MPHCPECDERLDAPADECPYCGAVLPRKRTGGSAGAPPRRSQKKRPRAEGARRQSEAARRRSTPQRANKSLLVVGLAVAGLVGIGAIAVTVSLLTSGGGRSLFGRDARASKNHLTQLGLGLHMYHDVYIQFPPGGIFDTAGRGHHGWQTSLLPYVEQGPLFERIDGNRPWDDPVQGDAFQAEIPGYLIPGGGESKNAQGYALSHYAGNDQLFQRNSSLRIANAMDGASNTFFAGEAEGNFRPWGHPENWRNFSAGINVGPDGFGNPTGDGCLILTMDGAVRELQDGINPAVLKALATPAGGESIE